MSEPSKFVMSVLQHAKGWTRSFSGSVRAAFESHSPLCSSFSDSSLTAPMSSHAKTKHPLMIRVCLYASAPKAANCENISSSRHNREKTSSLVSVVACQSEATSFDNYSRSSSVEELIGSLSCCNVTSTTFFIRLKHFTLSENTE